MPISSAYGKTGEARKSCSAVLAAAAEIAAGSASMRRAARSLVRRMAERVASSSNSNVLSRSRRTARTGIDRVY
jgi:hypothetical protein